MFFFRGYQGTHETISPAANIAFVATPATLQGDFTAIASPACNNGKQITLKARFANNKVPGGSLNSVALAMLKFLPLSNDPCGQLTYSIPGRDHDNQETGRVDWNRSATHSIFAWYFVTDFEHPPIFNNNLLNASTDPSVDLADLLPLSVQLSSRNTHAECSG